MHLFWVAVLCRMDLRLALGGAVTIRGATCKLLPTCEVGKEAVHVGRVVFLDAVGPGGAEGELGACTPYIILNSFSVALPHTMPNCTTLSNSTSPPSERTKKASWSTTIGKKGTLMQGLLVLF